ncbi:hypothetical protein HMPREF9148_01142 [Prevotella sp. F0091]|nr:hypothetical protein HMPREF9148_01142 [Prevotella sp. F0091]
MDAYRSSVHSYVVFTLLIYNKKWEEIKDLLHSFISSHLLFIKLQAS